MLIRFGYADPGGVGVGKVGLELRVVLSRVMVGTVFTLSLGLWWIGVRGVRIGP